MKTTSIFDGFTKSFWEQATRTPTTEPLATLTKLKRSTTKPRQYLIDPLMCTFSKVVKSKSVMLTDKYFNLAIT
jgi:hypothetical protein